MYKKILVAYDGSNGARLALKRTIRLVQGNHKVNITALWVNDSLIDYPEKIDDSDFVVIDSSKSHHEKLHKEVDNLCKNESKTICLVSVIGNPSKMIIEFAAKNDIQLIVMGQSGHSNLWENLLGHTSHRVSQHAHCDVLIVRTH